MSDASNDQLLGVVLLARHGDRRGFYQDPKTYTPSFTAITPTGTEEEVQLGQFLRQRYLNDSSPFFIKGINNTIADGTQIHARADAGGEGGVIYESAIALLQGLFPPTPKFSEILGNGTNITAPFGGYQYIPVESVEPENDRSLEGWTSCNTFNQATTDFYASPQFKAKSQDNAAFLSSLPSFLDGRSASLEDAVRDMSIITFDILTHGVEPVECMYLHSPSSNSYEYYYQIFDFMNVQFIHDPIFGAHIPPPVLAHVRDLANFHEYGVFSSADLGGIGNIAGRTILPSILEGFNQIASSSNPLKILYQAISYKPFISLFNMTGTAQQDPAIAGIVDYAAVLALEVRSSSSGPVIRFNLKNGTAEADFTTINMFGASGDVPLSQFSDHLSGVAINDLATWCNVCQNTKDRGCGDLTIASKQAIDNETLHPVGAGLLGAGMAIAFMLILLLFVFFFGFVKCGVTRKRKSGPPSEESSVVKT